MILKKMEVGHFLSNCYIVGSEETGEGMIIDPGGEAERILKTTEELGLSIVLIVATHLHADHIAALNQVKKATMADYAVHEALTHIDDLDYQGGAIVIDSKVAAFSLGEALNESTAVVHIEKANPEIPGLYTAINQLFCQHAWSEMVYINREQDLGVEGLRKAKESYYPHHMVDKYTVIPKR